LSRIFVLGLPFVYLAETASACTASQLWNDSFLALFPKDLPMQFCFVYNVSTSTALFVPAPVASIPTAEPALAIITLSKEILHRSFVFQVVIKSRCDAMTDEPP